VLVAVREAYGDAHQRMLPLGETFEDAAATPGATWSSLWRGCAAVGRLWIRSDAIHLARRSADSATNRREAAHSRCLPGHGKPDSPPEFARRHVDSRAPDEG
jgi:hypothetical protein